MHFYNIQSFIDRCVTDTLQITGFNIKIGISVDPSQAHGVCVCDLRLRDNYPHSYLGIADADG